VTIPNNDLVTELRASHLIISNALQVMSPDQRVIWAQMNHALGLVEQGATRGHEREAVLNRHLTL